MNLCYLLKNMSSTFAIVSGSTSMNHMTINIANCIALNNLTGNTGQEFNFNPESFEGMESLELCKNLTNLVTTNLEEMKEYMKSELTVIFKQNTRTIPYNPVEMEDLIRTQTIVGIYITLCESCYNYPDSKFVNYNISQ